MTIREAVVKWNNAWRYDHWWRQKHNVAYNSRLHREMNQIDICFEYFENHMSSEAIDQYQQDKSKEEKFKEGKWIEENKGTEKASKEDFDKIDISNF